MSYSGQAFTDRESARCHALAIETSRPCLLLVGPPGFQAYPAVHAEDNRAVTHHYLISADPKWYQAERRFMCHEPFDEIEIDSVCPRYRDAISLSRGARFEFGEEGEGADMRVETT